MSAVLNFSAEIYGPYTSRKHRTHAQRSEFPREAEGRV